MSNWFYIQQWARKRWERVGVEMPFEEAHRLYIALNDHMSEKQCSPIALVRQGDKGVVIQKKEDKPEGWQEVMVNSVYLRNTEPPMVKRVD